MGWRSPKKGIVKGVWCKGQKNSRVKDMVIGPGNP